MGVQVAALGLEAAKRSAEVDSKCLLLAEKEARLADMSRSLDQSNTKNSELSESLSKMSSDCVGQSRRSSALEGNVTKLEQEVSAG